MSLAVGFNKMASFQYRYAVVRGIPNSFKTMCIRSSNESDIVIEKARKQHENYVATLKGLGLQIIEVPAREEYPDCVFVEDVAVVIDKTALICRPGAKSRAGEEVDARRFLGENPLCLKVVDVDDLNATIEGGDVMFSGREIFVGISKRTNEAGVDALAKAFPRYHVTSLVVPENGLHLKSVMSMISHETIAISKSESGQDLKRQLKEKAKFSYEFFEVEENVASNVLFINGTVVHQSEIVAPKSWKTLQSYNKHRRIALDTTELAKADGCLTCSSLLIA